MNPMVRRKPILQIKKSPVVGNKAFTQLKRQIRANPNAWQEYKQFLRGEKETVSPAIIKYFSKPALALASSRYGKYTSPKAFHNNTKKQAELLTDLVYPKSFLNKFRIKRLTKNTRVPNVRDVERLVKSKVKNKDYWREDLFDIGKLFLDSVNSKNGLTRTRTKSKRIYDVQGIINGKLTFLNKDWYKGSSSERMLALHEYCHQFGANENQARVTEYFFSLKFGLLKKEELMNQIIMPSKRISRERAISIYEEGLKTGNWDRAKEKLKQAIRELE